MYHIRVRCLIKDLIWNALFIGDWYTRARYCCLSDCVPLGIKAHIFVSCAIGRRLLRHRTGPSAAAPSGSQHQLLLGSESRDGRERRNGSRRPVGLAGIHPAQSQTPQRNRKSILDSAPTPLIAKRPISFDVGNQCKGSKWKGVITTILTSITCVSCPRRKEIAQR